MSFPALVLHAAWDITAAVIVTVVITALCRSVNRDLNRSLPGRDDRDGA